jgi:hypothetical protein
VVLVVVLEVVVELVVDEVEVDVLVTDTPVVVVVRAVDVVAPLSLDEHPVITATANIIGTIRFISRPCKRSTPTEPSSSYQTGKLAVGGSVGARRRGKLVTCPMILPRSRCAVAC